MWLLKSVNFILNHTTFKIFNLIDYNFKVPEINLKHRKYTNINIALIIFSPQGEKRNNWKKIWAIISTWSTSMLMIKSIKKSSRNCIFKCYFVVCLQLKVHFMIPTPTHISLKKFRFLHSVEAFVYIIYVCKIFLAISFVWLNNCRIGYFSMSSWKIDNLMAYATSAIQ